MIMDDAYGYDVLGIVTRVEEATTQGYQIWAHNLDLVTHQVLPAITEAQISYRLSCRDCIQGTN